MFDAAARLADTQNPFVSSPDLPQANKGGSILDYRMGMRRLAAGVSAVTTELGGERFGLLSTAVTSVSADPDVLLVSVNRAASSHDIIRAAGKFCVNVLHAEDEDLAMRFGTPKLRHLRFEGRDWTSLATGAPVLVGALVSFDCELLREVEIATHTLFLGRVVAVQAERADIAPLVYLDGGYRELRRT